MLTSALVWLLRVLSSVVSKTTGSVFSPLDGVADSAGTNVHLKVFIPDYGGMSTAASASTPASHGAHHHQQQHHNKRPVTLIYPTVSPETVVVPIVSCILGFPLLALLVICCLRRRAQLAREQERRKNYETNHGTFYIVRYSPYQHIGKNRAVTLRSERAMSRGFPSMELDTVMEERSDIEPEATVVEMITPDRDSADS